MSAVTLNNRIYSDDANPVTGLGNGGHRARLIPLFSDALVEIAKQVQTAGQSYRATSDSVVSIGAGAKSFVVASGKGFAVGDLILARQSANPANFMVGSITAFDAETGALTLSIAPGDFGGSGAVSTWVLLGPIGPRGQRGLAGLGYGWDAGTAAGDPGPGLMRANHATLASATALYIDHLDGQGVDLSIQLIAWGASTSAVKGRLTLRSQTDPSQQILFDVTAVSAATGHVVVSVTHRGGAASFAAGAAIDADFSCAGDRGDVGNPGQQFQFDAGTSAADPGPGRIRFNNAGLGGATAAYVDAIDLNGADVSAWLAALGAGTNNQKGVLRLQSTTTLTKFADFAVSAATNSSGYFTLALTYLSPSPAPAFAAGEGLALLWSRSGDKGETGPAGTIANAGDGAIAAPGIAFAAETGLGVRRKGAALAAVCAGGADLLELRPATLAEAQAGTNALAVMTPLRVANAIAALGGAKVMRVARTANSVLGAADSGRFIDVTANSFTQTFAACASLGAGWSVFLGNSGAGDVTLDPNGSETIDGLASFVMYPGEIRLITCDGTSLTSFVLNPFYKTFTASGSFVKPPGYRAFGGLAWSGGASGKKRADNTGPANGGGGGGCFPFTLLAALMAASTTITIGAGGAPTTGMWSNGGGSTSIGALIEVQAGGDAVGGGVGGSPSPFYGSSNTFNPTIYGGGGTNNSANFGGFGTLYGGGAGGGVSTDGAFLLLPGVTAFGGAGGVGSINGNGADGAAPSGGGGSTRNGTQSGAGARGEVQIWGIC